MSDTRKSAEAGRVEAVLARHGKLSYLQIPAVNPEASGAFYAQVFGWSVGGRPEHVSFSDASDELIGAFVKGPAASGEPGLLPYIYVNGLDDTLARIEEHGGSVVRPPYLEGELWVATFRDPAGNVLGTWQAGGR